MKWTAYDDTNLTVILYGEMQVAVKGKNAVVLGVEKKSLLQLQDPRTVRKIAMLDEHVCLAFAGGCISNSLFDNLPAIRREADRICCYYC